MKKALKMVVTIVAAIAVLASVTVLPAAAYSEELTSEEASVSENRPYWQGEPMTFEASFAAANNLSLFTLPDADDAEGFIYGMWVRPGFVLFRHSFSDTMHYAGWEFDWEAEDERIRPMLCAEDEGRLFDSYPDTYERLASRDRQINQYLSDICADLDDLWWLYRILTSNEGDVLRRPHLLVQSLVTDIQDTEGRIQDRLVERNEFYGYVLEMLHGGIEEEWPLGYEQVFELLTSECNALLVSAIEENELVDEIAFDELLIDDGSSWIAHFADEIAIEEATIG